MRRPIPEDDEARWEEEVEDDEEEGDSLDDWDEG